MTKTTEWAVATILGLVGLGLMAGQDFRFTWWTGGFWFVALVVAIATFSRQKSRATNESQPPVAALSQHVGAVTFTQEWERPYAQELARSSAPEMIQGTTNANIRVELLRRVLREAAAAARAAVEGRIDYGSGPTTDRAALHLVLLQIVRDLFSHRVIADFDSWRKAIDAKQTLRNQSPDGKTHFLEIADYFERLADRLEFEDVDPKAGEFTSFAQYRAVDPWSRG